MKISIADLRELRINPARASEDVITRLGQVLLERGKGMARVGELLLEDE